MEASSWLTARRTVLARCTSRTGPQDRGEGPHRRSGRTRGSRSAGITDFGSDETGPYSLDATPSFVQVVVTHGRHEGRCRPSGEDTASDHEVPVADPGAGSIFSGSVGKRSSMRPGQDTRVRHGRRHRPKGVPTLMTAETHPTDQELVSTHCGPCAMATTATCAPSTWRARSSLPGWSLGSRAGQLRSYRHPPSIMWRRWRPPRVSRGLPSYAASPCQRATR